MTRTLHVIGNVQLDVLASPVTAMPLPGGDDIIDSIAVRPAGAAGNVSLALAALGAQHRLFGAVGDDQAGIWVADELRSLGLGDDLQVVEGQETGISIALEAPERERAFLTAHGVLDSYTEQDVPADAVDADLVLLTGYFSMPGLRRSGARRLLERARERGPPRCSTRAGIPRTGPATPSRRSWPCCPSWTSSCPTSRRRQPWPAPPT